MLYQVLPSMAPYDAITHHALRIDDELRKSGVDTMIVADHIAPSLRGRVTLANTIDSFDDSHVLYHMSIASRLLEKVHDSKAEVDMWYHNITPASYFEQWEPYVTLELRIARFQLSQMAIRARRGVAASHFSEKEMKDAGCRNTSVMPVLFDVSNKVSPSVSRSARRGTSILSVGRYAPHKKVERVISVFALYKELVDHHATLHLVGSSASQWYKESLDNLVDKSGISDSIYFHEGASDSELAELYATSDAYLCMSEHEGFCVPLVEAQYAQLPVVATDCAAIPETVGNAGIILESNRDDVDFVAALEIVVRDKDINRQIRHNARDRNKIFDIDREAARCVQWLTEAHA